MKHLILTLILLSMFLSVPSYAEWTKKDTSYQVTYVALHVVDWGQTRYIAENPDKHYEINPLLGKHPNVRRVNGYFITTLIGHTFVSYILPPKYRRVWQSIWIGLKIGLVAHNYNATIKISF